MSFLLYKLLLVGVMFTITLVVAMYATYGERKIAAFLQDRLGPNRAGIFGIFQPLADGMKFFMKEEIIPNTSNKFLFILGPGIAMITALMAGVLIPWGGTLEIGGEVYSLQIADLNIGILYVFAVVSIGVYGIMIGGWASNNKFSLLGAIRASAQMISYELAMGIAIIALIIMTGTLSLGDITRLQGGGVGSHWNFWNVVYQPVGFLLFIICAFAECNRAPFDLAECETELVGGYHTEYSSMKLGFYMFAEYINMFVSSAVISTLYFGGYNFPFMNDLGLDHNTITILGTVFMFGKVFFFIFFFIWVRWTLPRFRYDQLMNLGWKTLLPLSIVNLLVTAVILILTGK
ncbi:MAG TPA: NADH-quinone oxidoreductase subunit NuoH [Cyclobacteriaceae bacterium]|jgi:NADH-quinone oxidoreductase subunit H|nr:NADH-quinone oxidoreductase subunit NuoH [Cyclobacteriaceae bacterium]